MGAKGGNDQGSSLLVQHTDVSGTNVFFVRCLGNWSEEEREISDG